MPGICVYGAGNGFRTLLDGMEHGVRYDPAGEDVCCDLAVFLPGIRRLCGRLHGEVLLLWGESAEALLRKASGQLVVSCGFSPRDTLTVASMEDCRTVLTVQRELLRPDGRRILPQDIPLPECWRTIPAEERVMLAGLLLMRRALPA